MRLRAPVCVVSVWRARAGRVQTIFFFSKRIYRVELSPSWATTPPPRRLGGVGIFLFLFWSTYSGRVVNGLVGGVDHHRLGSGFLRRWRDKAERHEPWCE